MDNNRNLKIKDWAIEDRPREKLLSKGANNLSNAELIAILLGSGNKNETAVELSKKILKDVNNNLNEFAKISIEQLMEYKGVGDAKAVTILASLELGRRQKISKSFQKAKIISSKSAYDIFSVYLSDIQHEEFWAMYLNSSMKIIETVKINQGSTTSLSIDNRVIFKKAYEKNANSIIVCHNHPSGNIEPSDIDIALTSKLVKAGKILDITINDHIIIADNRYFSFLDRKLI